MNAAVEAAGGNLNGVTTRDHGYYYTPVHPDHFGTALDVLGDMLCRPLLTELEIERKVILEEMLRRFPTWDCDEARVEMVRTSTVRGPSRVPVTV